MKDVAIGFDIGGTKIAAGVVDRSGKVLHRLRVATPDVSATENTLAVVARVAGELREVWPGIVAVGIGIAGMVDWPEGYVRWAPNSPYEDLHLRRDLMRETRLPVAVDNDANVAALGEARFGAAMSCSNLVALTIGTGIGGGVLVADQVVRGATGIAAEVGHMVLAPSRTSPVCGCGGLGCFEAMASGTALTRMASEQALAEPGGAIARLGSSRGRVDGEIVEQAARAGDEAALAILDSVGFWLGLGLANVTTLFDPELVVLAGGVVDNAYDLLEASIQTAYMDHLFASTKRKIVPLIVRAKLGPDTGVVGAAALAFDERGRCR